MNDVVCKHGWSRRFCEPCSSAHIISQLKWPRDMGMLAIKPENVPQAVWLAMRDQMSDGIKNEATLIAAALNAWPGAGVEGYTTPHLILPLTQEANDE